MSMSYNNRSGSLWLRNTRKEDYPTTKKFDAEAFTHGQVADLDSAESVEFLMEPEVYEGSFSVRYNPQGAVGMSHEYMGYQNASNEAIPIRLNYGRLAIARRADYDFWTALVEMERQRDYFSSLRATDELGDGKVSAVAPAVQVLVPGILNLRCVLTNFSWRVPHRDRQGNMMRLIMDLQFTEAPVTRWTSAELRMSRYTRVN